MRSFLLPLQDLQARRQAFCNGVCVRMASGNKSTAGSCGVVPMGCFHHKSQDRPCTATNKAARSTSATRAQKERVVRASLGAAGIARSTPDKCSAVCSKGCSAFDMRIAGRKIKCRSRRDPLASAPVSGWNGAINRIQRRTW
jgi:hypothetical protein